MSVAIDFNKAQLDYDFIEQVHESTELDDLQTDFINRLECINFDQIIAERFKSFVDYHDISEALKECRLEFETLFSAISYEIAIRKLGG